MDVYQLWGWLMNFVNIWYSTGHDTAQLAWHPQSSGGVLFLNR